MVPQEPRTRPAQQAQQNKHESARTHKSPRR
jgi:hypothetical protein